jgi:hypothetical protein
MDVLDRRHRGGKATSAGRSYSASPTSRRVA